MSTLVLNTREIRSFKLYKQTFEIKTFFDNIKNDGLFMMCDSLHPKDRVAMRGMLTTQNLELKTLPKNVIRFLFKDKEKKILKNLLSGNVVLIKDIKHNRLSEKQLDFLLKQEKLSIRFLYSNGTIYRRDKIENFLKKQDFEKNPKLILQQLYLPLNCLLNSILTFSSKSNYINE